jgi:transcription termination factor NusB
MRFSLKSKKQRRRERKKERARVLDFISNNAAKNDFIDWLNANYEHQFPEDASWDQIIRQVKSNTNIHNTALHNYATTLTEEEDITKLLKDVEKETTKAEETVSQLYDTAHTQRLRPVIGGACILGGFLLLVAAVGLITGVIDLDFSAEVGNYLAVLSGIYGLLTTFAGLLLTIEI